MVEGADVFDLLLPRIAMLYSSLGARLCPALGFILRLVMR